MVVVIFIRYNMLIRGLARCDDPKEACLQVLHLYDSSSVEWQLGKTRVRNTVSSSFIVICNIVLKII